MTIKSVWFHAPFLHPKELKGVPRSRSKVCGINFEFENPPDWAPRKLFRCARRSGQVLETGRRVLRPKTVALGLSGRGKWQVIED